MTAYATNEIDFVHLNTLYQEHLQVPLAWLGLPPANLRQDTREYEIHYLHALLGLVRSARVMIPLVTSLKVQDAAGDSEPMGQP